MKVALRMLVCTTMLAACGSPEVTAPPIATETAGPPVVPTESETPEPQPAPTPPEEGDAEAADTAEGTQDAAEDDPALRGIGMTRQRWDATHEQAAGYVEGAAYGPLINGDQPAYGGVFGEDRILGYSYHASAELSDSEFLQLIEATELPADAVHTTTMEDCEDGPVRYYESAAISGAVDGATSVYVAADRYAESDYLSAAIGVGFGDPSC